jgi:Fe-S oxidoreductase
MTEPVTFRSFSKRDGALIRITPDDQTPLPPPYDNLEEEPFIAPLADAVRKQYVTLDDTIAVSIPRPTSAEQEEKLVNAFLSGLRKLFNEADNWTFLQPLLFSIEHCARCQTCSDACPIFAESGNNELYRPSFRSEILRRIYFKYVKGASVFNHGDIDLNWKTVARLIELAYRCNICRRCAQTCPMAVDNGLLAREIRKIASQEMGIQPKELHRDGSMLQLKVGSSTGMSPEVLKDNMRFIDEDTSDKTGIKVVTPFDKQGADILLIHNAGEVMAWPENIGAFSLLFNQAGLNWTLSSEGPGYDGVNYGVFYDDAQFARLALRHARIAQKLGVKKIVLGECGHAHKALTVIADKVLTGSLNVPRESSMPVLREILRSGRIKFDPSRNDFPVTLHDPCNYVRMMGVVTPQREILKQIVPAGRFREMEPHGVDNYCCGGGSGFAIMSGHNFESWRHRIAGRRKFRQILLAFQGEPWGAEHHKYVCAPCSNCKGQIRAILGYYQAPERTGLHYGGLVELMVNAMVDAKPNYIDWEWH